MSYWGGNTVRVPVLTLLDSHLKHLVQARVSVISSMMKDIRRGNAGS